MTTDPRVIWIDLENTPHVPFFLPIIRELEQHGITVFLTARDFAQTVELAHRVGLKPLVIGRGGSSSALRKAAAIAVRALQLARVVRKKRVSLAVGHGSRGMLFAGKLLGIRTLTLYDYEGASVRLFNRFSSFVMTPAIIPESSLVALGLSPARHLTYPGLKEEVYLHDFKASTTLPVRLGLSPNNINVIVRPPSDTAHYRSQASNTLFDQILHVLSKASEVHVILLPRDAHQRADLTARCRAYSNVVIPERAVDGASLLHYSDLVIGGGGTMNREAAVLGVPVLSIFKGAEGAVDRHLKQLGKLVDVHSVDDILPYLQRRERKAPEASKVVLDTIVSAILRLSANK